MYYGNFDLVNFISADRDLFEADILDYKDFDTSKLKLSAIVKAHKDNLWALYSSMWRIAALPALGSKPVISEYAIARRVEAVYLDELFPRFFQYQSMWLKYMDRIQAHCEQDWKRLGALIRQSGIRFILTPRPCQMFDKDVAKLYIKIWKWMGFPTSGNYVVSHRFYLHTSNLKGKTVGEKSKTLKSLPKAVYEKIALITDDISFIDGIRLCKKYNVRGSFDIAKIRDQKKKRITIDSKEWKYLEATWISHKGSSPMLPTVFTSDKLEHSKMEKILKHYVRRSNVVIY